MHMKQSNEKKYVFETVIKVRDYEVDSEGIVNNANYLHYLEHTRHEFCEFAGFSFRQMHASKIFPVVSHVEIDYRSSLGLGDSMISRLALQRKGPLFIFIQDIFSLDERPVVNAKVMVATLVDGRLTRGEELYEKFKDYVE